MRKQINRLSSTSVKDFPQMKVVENQTNHVHVEIEIENHVKSIRALIQKLKPADRQRYFDGLLNHLLCKEIEYPQLKPTKTKMTKSIDDYSQLSENDLELIRELSCKLQDLYVRTGDVVE